MKTTLQRVSIKFWSILVKTSVILSNGIHNTSEISIISLLCVLQQNGKISGEKMLLLIQRNYLPTGQQNLS